jgi:hypothetical protein
LTRNREAGRIRDMEAELNAHDLHMIARKPARRRFAPAAAPGRKGAAS